MYIYVCNTYMYLLYTCNLLYNILYIQSWCEHAVSIKILTGWIMVLNQTPTGASTSKQSKHTLIELAEKRCNSPPFPSCPACTELEHSFWIAGAKFSRPPWKSFSNLDQETSMLCLSCVQMLTQFKPMNHQFLCHASKPVVFGCSLQSLPIFKKQLNPSTRHHSCLSAFRCSFRSRSSVWQRFALPGIRPSSSLLCFFCLFLLKFSTFLLKAQKKMWTQHLSPVCICHALVWNRVRHQTTLSKWTWCQCSGSAPLPSSAFPLALLVWRVHAFPASKGRQGKGRARLQVLSNSFPESFRFARIKINAHLTVLSYGCSFASPFPHASCSLAPAKNLYARGSTISNPFHHCLALSPYSRVKLLSLNSIGAWIFQILRIASWDI